MKYVKTYLKISIAGVIIAFIYHYIVGNYLKYGWPYNSFLFTPSDKFMDFFNTAILGKFVRQGLNPYGRGVINIYMPFTNWLTIPFSYGNDYIRYGIFVSAIILVFYLYFYKFICNLNRDRKKEALQFSFFILISSYPIMTLLDRGNFEFLVFVFLSVFIYYYKNKNYYIAAFMLTLATSLKPFSIVFIVLFLSDKKYKQLFSYIAATITILIVSLAALPGGLVFNFNNWLKELDKYTIYYVNLWMGNYNNHALYSPIHLLNWRYFIYGFDQLRKIYFSIAVIIFVLISLYIVEKEKSLARKVFLLFLCMIGLPYVSSDYTLINLYIPITLLIEEIQNQEENKYVNMIIILTAVLMMPKNYTIPVTNLKYGLAVIINPFIISALFIIIILYSKKYNKQLDEYSKSLCPI